MNIFFGKMGITNLKYKPAYNPCESILCHTLSYVSGTRGRNGEQ